MGVMEYITAENNLRAYFKELVEEAIYHQNLDVTEVSQFYLVNLMDNFAKTEHLFDREEGRFEEVPLATLLTKALEAELPLRVRIFKKLGDVSLYIAGYFADHIDSRFVDVDYYVSMGEGAYKNLAGILSGEKTFCELYDELAERFEDLMDVLSEVRNSGGVVTNLALMRLYERWLKTGDRKIRERLVKEGILPVPKN